MLLRSISLYRDVSLRPRPCGRSPSSWRAPVERARNCRLCSARRCRMRCYSRALHGSPRSRAGFGDQPDRSRCDCARGRPVRHIGAVLAGSPLMGEVHLFRYGGYPLSPSGSWGFKRSTRCRVAVVPAARRVTALCRDCDIFATISINENCGYVVRSARDLILVRTVCMRAPPKLPFHASPNLHGLIVTGI